MFKEGVLTRVKQFGIEVHTREILSGNPASHAEDFVRYTRILKQLEDIGFLKWYSHLNPQGIYMSERTGSFVSCCYELVYINRNYLPG